MSCGVDMIEFLKPDFEFSDDRGYLKQICHEGWKQINVSMTRKGTFRGGHCHKINREAFYILSGEIEIKAQRGAETKTYTVRENSFFVIAPHVVHSFEFKADTLMIALYDRGVVGQNGEKDICLS